MYDEEIKASVLWTNFNKFIYKNIKYESVLSQDFQVNYLVYDNKTLTQSAWCSIPFNEQPTGSVYMMLASTIIYFFAPLFIVGLLYTK